MALRVVSSRPGAAPSRRTNGAGAPPPGRPPSGLTRIVGLILLALCLAGLYAAFAWQPCAECAAL